MINRLIGGVALGLFAFGVANANSVSLIAPAEVSPGETFTVDVVGDFGSDGFLAGGILVTFDPALVSVEGFDWGSDLLPPGPAPEASCFTPNAPCFMDAAEGNMAIVWGSFDILGPGLVAPDSAPAILATLTMQAAGDRGASALINLDIAHFLDIPGGWFGSGVVPIANPDLFGASIAVTTTVVPLPAAAWLMIGGLGALFGFRRK